MWESEEEPAVKDDFLLSAPHPLFLDIFCDSDIYDFSCENSFMDVSTFDNSHNTQDVSPSFDCGEDTSLFSNPPKSFIFYFGNSGG